MRHLATAALLAAPMLLAAPSVASANGPFSYGFGYGGVYLNWFPRIHQHGPLYNYGPYYGYPPFEPYGPWNPYLQYTGPVGEPMYAGGGHQWHKWGQGNPHPLFHKKASSCDSCGSGAPSCGKAGHCHTCAAAAAAHLTAGNAIDRYTGYGDPRGSAAYYTGAPGLTTAPVLPAGYYGR